MMKRIFDVKLSKKALKDLEKVPQHVALKLDGWVEAVAHRGLGEVMKIPGFHDEPLKGKRFGERSIRLSRSYRAIYAIENDNVVQFIEIREVNKHEY